MQTSRHSTHLVFKKTIKLPDNDQKRMKIVQGLPTRVSPVGLIISHYSINRLVGEEDC